MLKGKPLEKVERKASSLSPCRGDMIAGLPGFFNDEPAILWIKEAGFLFFRSLARKQVQLNIWQNYFLIETISIGFRTGSVPANHTKYTKIIDKKYLFTPTTENRTL